MHKRKPSYLVHGRVIYISRKMFLMTLNKIKPPNQLQPVFSTVVWLNNNHISTEDLHTLSRDRGALVTASKHLFRRAKGPAHFSWG